MIRIGMTAIALLLAVSTTASAEQMSRSEEVVLRQEQSLASAVMTPRERRMIRREQAQVYAMERRFKADGSYTRSERRQVEAAQRRVNQLSRNAGRG